MPIAAIPITEQQRRTIVGQLWSSKSLRTSLTNCEGKVAVTQSSVLQIEESAPPQIVGLASGGVSHGGCLWELANCRIKNGDETAWPIVRQALWFATIGVVGEERMYWFNRHRKAFEWQRYDVTFVKGLWFILAAYYFEAADIIDRLVPVLTRMMRSPECLSSVEDIQYQGHYEQKYALSRFVGRILKERVGVEVPEFLQAGSGETPSPLCQWSECLDEEAQRTNIVTMLDWHLYESGLFPKRKRGISGGAITLLTPWEVFAMTLDKYHWIRELQHPYVNIMIFPPRNVLLTQDKTTEVFGCFAERVLKETEGYITDSPVRG